MDILIVSIDNATLPGILPECRACSYWEKSEAFSHGKCTEDEARVKAEWFERLLSGFGPCGKLLYIGDEPVGYCQYAPPADFPGILGYGDLAKSVDQGAVFISCLTVAQNHQRKGLGRRLLREVIDDVRSRGFRAVETFARNDSADNCSGPVQLYLSEDFTVVATEVYANGASLSLVRLPLR